MSDAHNSPLVFTTIQKALLLSLLIALVAAAGYWAYSTLEWEEKEIDLGYSKEALQNDYLAAEIFLRNHGVQATSVKNLKLLDQHRWRNIPLGQDDTIVLINANKTLTQERYDTLYEWVENGGTLITSTQNPFVGTHTDEEDLLLHDFNITPADDYEASNALETLDDIVESLDDNKDADEQSDIKEESNTETQKEKEKKKSTKDDKPENHYRCSLDEEPTEIVFADEQKPLRFDFSKRDAFSYYNENPAEDEGADHEEDAEHDDTLDEESDDEPFDEESGHESAHLLYFEIGEGGITITSDNSIWSNRRIDCHDHAYALWSLANHNGRVWFLINQDAPSLAAIIWRNAHYGVLAALLALALWLWQQSQRFGPVFVGETIARRSLAEHIYASAMLLWRNQQHPQLLNLLRKDILERLDEQHPQLDQAAGAARIEFLHELTGIAANDIQQALFADGLYQPQEFANAIAHLQAIRKQL